MCGYCGCSENVSHHHDSRIIAVEQQILSENQDYAERNRQYFKQRGIATLNLVSSPGAGKTTLLVNTLQHLSVDMPQAVIEGDQQTDLDAKRIAQTGALVLQINTGKTCHLDAHRISHAIADLKLIEDSLLYIENVGNLVCPALFDLGEAAKVVILSVTEGDDKPLKYPHMFEAASLMIINKVDLLPYVDFNVTKCIEYAKRINPNIAVLELSATGDINNWLNWLRNFHKKHLSFDKNSLLNSGSS